MYLLFDIGGTKTRLATSKDAVSFNTPIIIDTPQKFEEGISAFSTAVNKLVEGEKIEKAVGAVSGPLDKEHSMLVNAPNLKGWNGKPLKKELEKILSAPVVLENDAALVGLGEAVYGAGKGHNIVAYITVSTGVGGARIVGGKIDISSMGFEPGHQIIDFNGQDCPGLGCNGKGHLEGYVSGNALQHRFGKHPAEITDEKVWEELAQWLAIGLNNSIVHWSPDIVVLGGSMMTKTPGISIERVKVHLEKVNHIFPGIPILKIAELEDVGGLYGALELAKQHV